MKDRVDPDIRKFAIGMRKSPTEAERRLWWALRHRLALANTHFRRQVVINRAIVDFACVGTRTIVEVDGDQHGHDAALAFDAQRTQALETAGWRVLRFSNRQVLMEMDIVLDTILAAIEGRHGSGRLDAESSTPDPSS